MDLLYALQNIRNPFLDVIFKIFTTFGEQYCVMVLFCVFAWCVDKRFAYKTGFVYSIGLSVNQLLKVSFCVKRPWVIDKRIKLSPLAEKTATGYSFPSGHVQSGATLFGMLISKYKNKILRIVFAFSMLLLAVSRMYFGAHTLLDVLTSLVIGLLLVIFSDKMYELFENHDVLTLIIGVVFTVIFVLFSLYKPYPSTHDFKLSFDCFKIAGAVCGFLIGWFLEKRFVNYKTNAKLPIQFIKVIIGLAVMIAIKLVFKKCFDETLFIVMFLPNFLAIFWGMFVYPLIFNTILKNHRS